MYGQHPKVPDIMLKLPVIDSATVPEQRGSGYPEPFRSRMGDRMKRRLGDACGLTKFGVNLVTLGPGGCGADPMTSAGMRVADPHRQAEASQGLRRRDDTWLR